MQQCPSKPVPVTGVEKCLVDFDPPQTFVCPTTNIMIRGNVVAVLKDKNGNFKPDSAAEALLFVVVKDVTCSVLGSPPSNSSLSRFVTLTDSPSAVFAANSNITILAQSSQLSLDSPNWGGSGCPSNNKGILTANCSFPLGIDVSNTRQAQLSAKFPAERRFCGITEKSIAGTGRDAWSQCVCARAKRIPERRRQ